MIQLNLSKNLAKPLAMHLAPTKIVEADFVWRADVALIGVDTCLVAQELYTNYLMVFCGLNARDFTDFPTLFCDRFWREATAICMQANRYEKSVLSRHIKSICQPQHYQLDPEPLEEGRITKMMEKLERRFIYDRAPLPTEGKKAFEFGFETNAKKSKSSSENRHYSPMEMLGNICLNLIEEQIVQEEEAKTPIISTRDNIVTVDFAKNRRLG